MQVGGVATNKWPILPCRDVARPGVRLAIEVIMDAIAHGAGIEAYEARLRRVVQAEHHRLRRRGAGPRTAPLPPEAMANPKLD
ncbi:MAG: molybdopterin-dependent oxidoreductase, partial [Acetobacteraceae bacterium]|nr:molybdopterin-dependent oxidoreductase [Acetobacteraceae bacterium]